MLIGLGYVSYAINAVHRVHSSFAIVFTNVDEERADGFSLIVYFMSCDCLCSVALPRGSVGWSAVCDCGISWSYSLTFYTVFCNK